MTKVLRIRKERESLNFSSLAKLLAGQGADEFVTSEMIIPYMNAKLSEYQSNLIANAPAALDTLNEIALKLGELGASDSYIESLLASIVSTTATVASVDAKLALKADSTTLNNEILNLTQNVIPLKANVTSLNTEISNRQSEISRIEQLVVAEATQREIVVATKTTPAEVTTIAQALVATLRTEMLAIEGIDDAEFARLQGLLTQLTALEAADVTGLNASIAQKVDKASVIARSSWITPEEFYTVEDFLDPALLNSDYVFSAELNQVLIGLLNSKINTKFDSNQIVQDGWASNLLSIDGSGKVVMQSVAADALHNSQTMSARLTLKLIQLLFEHTEEKVDSEVVAALQNTVDAQANTITTLQADYASLLQRVLDLEDSMMG